MDLWLMLQNINLLAWVMHQEMKLHQHKSVNNNTASVYEHRHRQYKSEKEMALQRLQFNRWP